VGAGRAEIWEIEAFRYDQFMYNEKCSLFAADLFFSSRPVLATVFFIFSGSRNPAHHARAVTRLHCQIAFSVGWRQESVA
jgi:hypothetical protein